MRKDAPDWLSAAVIFGAFTAFLLFCWLSVPAPTVYIGG